MVNKKGQKGPGEIKKRTTKKKKEKQTAIVCKHMEKMQNSKPELFLKHLSKIEIITRD
jgi:hypothetical protein